MREGGKEIRPADENIGVMQRQARGLQIQSLARGERLWEKKEAQTDSSCERRLNRQEKRFVLRTKTQGLCKGKPEACKYNHSPEASDCGRKRRRREKTGAYKFKMSVLKTGAF
jgi:hypothetical protein